MVNPLLLDRTRGILSIRKQLTKEIEKLFRALERDLVTLLVADDVLGMKQSGAASYAVPGSNLFVSNAGEWQFLTDAEKLTAFKNWLRAAVSSGLLRPEDPRFEKIPWMAKFLRSAHIKGVEQAFKDLKPAIEKTPVEVLMGFQFSQTTISSDVAVKTLQRIFTRSFDGLQNISAQMDADLSRVFANGVARGSSPFVIARDIRKEMKMSKMRALRLARTELAFAYAEGQLDGYQELGEGEVILQVEWVTSGAPCPRCAEYGGTIMSLDAARGLIPLHPNCRCAWSPVVNLKTKNGTKTNSPKKLFSGITGSGVMKIKKKLQELDIEEP